MGTGGAARAGCLGFSLVGVLVSVGLVLWLGSQAFDGVTGGVGDGSLGSSAPSTTTPPRNGLVVRADPTTGLTGDASITVTASDLLPGEQVLVVACGAAVDAISGSVACDTATELSTTASAAGMIEVRFAMPRVVRAAGLPIDCAHEAGTCEVRVQGLESSVAGNVPVSFAEGLGPPDPLEDPGS